MMTLADATVGLTELTDTLTGHPEGPTPQKSIALIDQWVGLLEGVETTQPLVDTLTALKEELSGSDKAAIQQRVQTLGEQISELSTKMGAEGEMPSLLEGLAATLRQTGDVSRADSVD